MEVNTQQSAFLQKLQADNNPHQDRMQSLKNKNSDGTTSKKEQLMADRDAYLQLLITQLKNQNPQDPQDTNQMTQQIISISQAEQTIQMNENMEKMLNIQEHNQRLNAVNLINKTAEYDDAEQELQIGKSSDFSYKLFDDANLLKVEIKDSKGHVIRTLETKAEHKKAGEHILNWDGRNESGELMPEGKYKLNVTALDENNAPITVSTVNKAKIMGIIENKGKIELLLSNGKTLNQAEARMFIGDLQQMIELTDEQKAQATKEVDLAS